MTSYPERIVLNREDFRNLVRGQAVVVEWNDGESRTMEIVLADIGFAAIRDEVDGSFRVRQLQDEIDGMDTDKYPVIKLAHPVQREDYEGVPVKYGEKVIGKVQNVTVLEDGSVCGELSIDGKIHTARLR